MASHRDKHEIAQRCESCGSMVIPDRRSPMWRFAVAAAWTACLLLCAATVLSSILMIVVAPIALFIGMFLLSVSYAGARRPARCPVCAAAMFPEARQKGWQHGR